MGEDYFKEQEVYFLDLRNGATWTDTCCTCPRAGPARCWKRTQIISDDMHEACVKVNVADEKGGRFSLQNSIIRSWICSVMFGFYSSHLQL